MIEAGIENGGVDSDEETGMVAQEPKRKRAKQSKPSKAMLKAMSSSRVVCSVVKLFVKSVQASYTAPWRKESQKSCTGTGFIVNDNGKLFIMTNAHVVNRATTILARSQVGPPVKFRCEIESMSLPFDLALLRVAEDEACKITLSVADAIEFAGSCDNKGGNGDSLNSTDKKENQDNDSETKDSSPTTTTTTMNLFGQLPNLDDNVTCVGFPMGGDQISVTRGVVSRIQVSNSGMLQIQIDAAINPGNSGGPVFDKYNRVIGVASSGIAKASNIGFIIPASVVKLFLATAPRVQETGREALGLGALAKTGISSLGISGTQRLESPVLRKNLGLPADNFNGIRITGTTPLGASVSLLHADDVLTEIDGVVVGQDGTIQLPGRANERISFRALITCCQPGQEVRLTVMRRASSDNAEKDNALKLNSSTETGGGPGGRSLADAKTYFVTVAVRPRRYRCPRLDGWDCCPRYLIYGGCVFVPLTTPWCVAKKKGVLLERFKGPLTEEGSEVIVLSKVLAHAVNVGYHALGCLVVGSCNGVKPFNLGHLARLLWEENNMDIHQLRMQGADHNDITAPGERLICLDTKKCMEAEAEILSAHMIARRCSQDIMVTDEGK